MEEPMKKHMILLISLGLLIIGCSNYENTNSQEDYERQVKEYDLQAQRVNKQLDDYDTQTQRLNKQMTKVEEQQQRMDMLLDRWEKQADRYDSILDTMGTKK
jgi:peptidoglycan hydrolase CwlO-like protein